MLNETPDNPPPPVPTLPSREAVELLADVLRRVLTLATPADDANPPAELLTRAQAAALLGVSLTSFSDLESRGFIGVEAVRLGDGNRIVRYGRAELLRWIVAGCPPRLRWVAMRNVAASRRAG